MNPKNAALEMRELAERWQTIVRQAYRDRSSALDYKVPRDSACTLDHLISMCDRIISGEIAGEKAHRWIGWIQGVTTARGFTTLKQCKDINHRA